MMNKTTKNLIILGTIIFSFAFANDTFAYSCMGYSCDNSDYSDTYTPVYRNNNSDYRRNQRYDSYYSNNNDYNRVYQVTQPAPLVNNYYYPTTTRVVTAPATTVTKAPVVAVETTKTTNNTSTPATSNNSAYNPYNPNGNLLGASAAGSGLTALSLGGSGGFMPSSIWQWIFVFILILVIIIISRMLIRKPGIVQESHTITTNSH